MTEVEDLRVGMIGLGNIGTPMAQNILRSGFDLTVFDRKASATDPVVRSGAQKTSSPGAVAAECDVISIVVVDDRQVQSVLYDTDGVLNSVRPGAIVFIHSTVTPKTCRDAAIEFAKRRADVLDAPITGAVMAAIAGTLTVLVGGESSGLLRGRPVLEAIGSRIIHLGDVGLGQVAKIVNNLIVGLNLMAVREGLDLAAAAGIENQRMLEVLFEGSGDSWAARNWDAMVQAASAYPGGPRGMIQLMMKDLGLALSTAEIEEVRLPITALATQLGDGLLGS